MKTQVEGEELYKLSQGKNEATVHQTIDENTLFRVYHMDYPQRYGLQKVNMDAYEASRTVLGVSPTSSFNYREQAMKAVEEDADEVFT